MNEEKAGKVLKAHLDFELALEHLIYSYAGKISYTEMIFHLYKLSERLGGLEYE